MIEVGKAGETHGHDLCNDFFCLKNGPNILIGMSRLVKIKFRFSITGNYFYVTYAGIS